MIDLSLKIRNDFFELFILVKQCSKNVNILLFIYTNKDISELSTINFLILYFLILSFFFTILLISFNSLSFIFVLFLLFIFILLILWSFEIHALIWVNFNCSCLVHNVVQIGKSALWKVLFSFYLANSPIV